MEQHDGLNHVLFFKDHSPSDNKHCTNQRKYSYHPDTLPWGRILKHALTVGKVVVVRESTVSVLLVHMTTHQICVETPAIVKYHPLREVISLKLHRPCRRELAFKNISVADGWSYSLTYTKYFFKNPSLQFFLQKFKFLKDVVYSEYIALLKN